MLTQPVRADHQQHADRRDDRGADSDNGTGQPVVVAVGVPHRCDPRGRDSIAAMDAIPAGKQIVVVIVDDHELFAQGLALLLGREWGGLFTVGGQTTRVEEAADLVSRCDADVAIVDLSMPPLGGVAAIRHIKSRHPRTRILALSGTDDVADRNPEPLRRNVRPQKVALVRHGGGKMLMLTLSHDDQAAGRVASLVRNKLAEMGHGPQNA